MEVWVAAGLVDTGLREFRLLFEFHQTEIAHRRVPGVGVAISVPINATIPHSQALRFDPSPSPRGLPARLSCSSRFVPSVAFLFSMEKLNL